MPIRTATPKDIPAITRIYNQSIVERIATADLEPKSEADRAEWMKQFSPRFPLWVALEEGRIVSYGGLSQYSPREGYRFAAENFVYVASDSRGRGHGHRMLEHVLNEAKRLGFRYLLARIFTHNEPSLKLHARLGFQDLGIQRKIVEMDGRWYDVTLMDKRLDSG